ncbi:MAG: glycosyltransferase family 87 protein [Terriglobales bacterium]|jgi:glycosyl transferase family 87
MIGIGRTFRHGLLLILSILSAFSMWYYVANVWGVGRSAQFSDLYAQWWAAHELFLHRRNPYSPAIAHEIQTVIYGNPISPVHPGDPAELSGGFAYPLYVVFLLWPTVHLSFPVAQVVFLCLFVTLTLASLLLWLYALRWRLPVTELVTLAIFTFASFPVLQGLKLQNLSLLAAFLVAATVASLAAEHFTLAGMLLAASTIKPQFVILLIPWLAFWVVGDWRKRRRLAWSFSAAVSVLILSSELLAPGWISRFFTIVRAYRQYTYGHSLLDVWFSRQIGMAFAAALVLAVLAVCWRCRSYPAQSSRFFLACSLTLAATLVVIPTLEPHSQLLLLPGVLFLLRFGTRIWRSAKIARLLLTAVWVLLGWAWTAAFGMMLAAIWLPAGTLLRFWMLPLYSSPLLPFGILVILGFLLASETGLSPARGMILES